MKRYYIIAALSFILPLKVASVVFAANPIQITAEPCFYRMPPVGIYPIKVVIQNMGPDVRGAIDVHDEEFGYGSSHDYTYPVDLPSGTVKQLIAYPSVRSDTSAVDVDFNGSAHADGISVPLQNGIGSVTNWISVGLIGDSPGALESVRTTVDEADRSSKGTLGVSDSYCKPEDAPDRAIGYNGLKLLIIGEGSERLTDDQWTAINEWVTSGGSLLLIGGAGSTTYLDTTGGEGLCPLTAITESQISSLRVPSASGEETFGNVAIVDGQLKPGSVAIVTQGGKNLFISELYGGGMVTLCAYNPLAQPIVGTDGAPALLRQVIKWSENPNDPTSLFSWARQFAESDTADSSKPLVEIFPAGSETSFQNPNPFKIHLPPFGEVAAIFVVYFLLAIPITYGVLKRIGRLELSWITTPIISVAFAFVFYIFSASLYKAGITRRTDGILTVASGESSAHFQGATELFVPQGGAYDIRISGSENLEEVNPVGDEDEYAAERSSDSLMTADTASGVEAVGLNLGNLAFRRFYYSQPFNMGGTITGSVTASTVRLRGSIINSTSFTLTGVTITPAVGLRSYAVADIAPGQSLAVDTESTTQRPAFLNQSQPNVTALAGAAILTAHLTDRPFGLQFGTDVSEPGSVALITTIPMSQTGVSH